MHEGPPQWLEFSCAMGKSRVKGARQAYNWALPEVCWGDFSLTKALFAYLSQHHPKDATFLWPALKSKPADLWQVCESSAFISGRKMSSGQFLQVFRGFL